jgi:hypothetical protein
MATKPTGGVPEASAANASVRDAELMEWLDGELENGHGQAMEQRLASDEELAGKANAVRALGELVRGHLERSADDVDPRSERMWAQIEKRIVADERADREVAAPAAAGGFASRGSWWSRAKNYVVGGFVGAAVSAAAAVMIAKLGVKTPAAPNTQLGQLGQVGPIPNAPATGDDAGTGRGSADPDADNSVPVAWRAPEVEALDTPGGSGSVLTFEDEDGGTTVIWVTPDDTEDL